MVKNSKRDLNFNKFSLAFSSLASALFPKGILDVLNFF